MERWNRWLPIALLGVALPVAAAQVGLEGEPLSLEVHGFVSQGFIYTSNQNNYLAKSNRGSFEFSEVGLNFTKPLTDRLRLGLQLFSRDLGPIGNYAIKADWFYLDYRLANWIGFRAGRVKLPFGLYNDTSDIDAARVSVLLPQSIYPAQNRDFLLAQTGVELYGYVGLGSGGALDYRLYAGTIYVGADNRPSTPLKIDEVTSPYVIGGRLLWETPLRGLHVGASLQKLRLDTKLFLDGPNPVTVAAEIPATLWVASAEYSASDLTVSAEYSRWRVGLNSSAPTIIPQATVVSERAYVMASYRLKSWLQPGVYYSALFPDVSSRSGRASRQHDVTATLRFDINDHWLFKLEAHYLNGTAALSSALNDNKPLNALAGEWGMILAKTTALF